MPIEPISTLIGLLLTLMVFSYLIGDNPAFRFAIYLFIGVASGYAAAATVHYVLLPRISALQTGDGNQLILGALSLLLALSVLAKAFPRLGGIGSIAMAILVGVGAAAALGGAVMGTLLPQAQASIDAFAPTAATTIIQRLLGGTVMLVGTVLTLASFHFSAGRAQDGTVKQNPILRWIAAIGRVFVAITLGVLFAGVYMATLTAMIERLSSIINFIRGLIGI